MPTPEQPSLIVRQKSPPNNEFPFASLSDWLIPTELFFVRNHFPSPDLDARDWRLRVGGAVERPIELDLDSIKAMRSTTLTAVVECAGNGRVYYVPPKEGLQWQNGAVGNAAWTGVLLREILEMAGVKRTACEVLLAGADSGVVDTNKKTASPGPIAFARSLPLEKAIADSTILAYSMNEEPLTRDHGYPLRAVVGGWFGMLGSSGSRISRLWSNRSLATGRRATISVGSAASVNPGWSPLRKCRSKRRSRVPCRGRVSSPVNRIGFSEPPGAERLLSGRCRSAPEMAGAGAREGSSKQNVPLHGACGSTCGPLKKWGDMNCDVARPMGRGACSPTSRVPTARATRPIGSFRWRLRSFPSHRRTRRSS
jgi:DMSO/TMAO reductase YedYZ molybdopterin-dependent catalytic subunit